MVRSTADGDTVKFPRSDSCVPSTVKTLSSRRLAKPSPSLRTATYSYADETISQPTRGSGRFGPLGPTSFRSSRCTFRHDGGLAQDCPVWTFPEFTRLFDVDRSTKALKGSRYASNSLRHWSSPCLRKESHIQNTTLRANDLGALRCSNLLAAYANDFGYAAAIVVSNER